MSEERSTGSSSRECVSNNACHETKDRESSGGKKPSSWSTETGSDRSMRALLSYYKDKVAAFEKEREDMLRRVNACEVSHAELHRATWNLKAREEEIQKLHKALSDANVHLLREREEMLQLRTENEQLKVQALKSRRRIQHLSSVADPATKNTAFFRGESQMTSSRADLYSGSSSNHVKGAPGKSISRDGILGEASLNCPKRKTGGVGFPGAHQEARRSRKKVLEGRHQAVQSLLTARIESLENRCKEQEDLHSQQRAALKKQVEVLQAKLELAERTARAATHDFLEMRHMSERKERETMEQMAALREANDNLENELRDTTLRVEREMRAVHLAEIENRERQKVIAGGLKASMHYNDLKDRYSTLQAESRAEVESLKAQAAQLRKKCQAAEKRRQLDFEGFTNDLNEVRRSLRSFEFAALGKNTDVSLGGARASGSEKGFHSEKASLLRQEIERVKEKIAALQPHFAAKQGDMGASKVPARVQIR